MPASERQSSQCQATFFFLSVGQSVQPSTVYFFCLSRVGSWLVGRNHPAQLLPVESAGLKKRRHGLPPLNRILAVQNKAHTCRAFKNLCIPLQKFKNLRTKGSEEKSKFLIEHSRLGRIHLRPHTQVGRIVVYFRQPLVAATSSILAACIFAVLS